MPTLLSPANEHGLLPLLAAAGVDPIYYKHLPILLVVVSLVYAATRYDDWKTFCTRPFAGASGCWHSSSSSVSLFTCASRS